jgi:hypothetical protein
MNADERTLDLMKRIRDILVWTAPEIQETRIARLCIDEMAGLVADGDRWFAKWLRHKATIDATREALWLDIAALVEAGEHWKWIHAEILEHNNDRGERIVLDVPNIQTRLSRYCVCGVSPGKAYVPDSLETWRHLAFCPHGSVTW